VAAFEAAAAGARAAASVPVATVMAMCEVEAWKLAACEVVLLESKAAAAAAAAFEVAAAVPAKGISLTVLRTVQR
jgi:hypothetical protein